MTSSRARHDAVAREDGFLVAMMAVAHDPTSRRPSRRAPARGKGRTPRRPAPSRRRWRRAPDRRYRAPRDRRGIPAQSHPPAGPAPARRRAPPPRRAPARPARRRSRARCAPGRRSRCDHSSCRSSANGSMQVFESLPTPNAPLRVEVVARRERAVAQIRLGRRREPGDRAARGEAARLVVGHVRRVHDAPARVDSAHDRAAIRPAARRSTRRRPRLRAPVRRRECGSGDRGGNSATIADSSSGVTARRLCGATPRFHVAVAASRASVATRSAYESTECTNRRWPGVGGAPPKSEWA